MDNFNEFRSKLDSYDLHAWEILKANIAIVVRNWCKKEYFEAGWVIYENKVIGEEEFCLKVYYIFRDRYDSINKHIESYSELKFHFIRIAVDLINNGFIDFMKKIQQNEDIAWKQLDIRLRPLLKGWLAQKGKYYLDSFDKVYSETLYIFIENLKKEKLYFDNSKKLKSYILKIAEYKLKELIKESGTDRFVSIEEVHFNEVPVFQTSQIEVIQQQEHVRDLLERLNDEERKILYGVYYYGMKLKDIAGTLNVSEESCRVKKHRALKKLQEQLIQVPYLND